MRRACHFGNTDHYVAAVEVLQVIGEGTEGLENLWSSLVLVPGSWSLGAPFLRSDPTKGPRLRWGECFSWTVAFVNCTKQALNLLVTNSI